MSTDVGWSKLRKLVLSLDESGPLGFEGLCAELFTLETGHKFFVARSGDQPVGDALSPEEGVSIQSKLYGETEIRAIYVEGDIDEVLRQFPGLDVYVVASTSKHANAQLKSRLLKKSEETGVDYVLAEIIDRPSGLSALLIHHFESLRHFFGTIPREIESWIADQDSEELLHLIEPFRNELKGLGTSVQTAAKSREFWTARFSDSGKVHGNPVSADGVPRHDILQRLDSWWTSEGSGIATIIGEEGTGKSWVSAKFADSLFGSEGNPIFWLDSIRWSDARDLDQLVDHSLKTIYPVEADIRSRLRRKIFRRWSAPILIVADGANERDGVTTAEKLVAEYCARTGELIPKLRLLFTTRPSNINKGMDSHIWSHGEVIECGGLSDEEFDQALTYHNIDIGRTELTPAILELARIPRYLELAVSLRSRLASFSNITREILLWAELERKCSRGDPQAISITREIGGTFAEILAQLASEIGWPGPGESSVPNDALREAIPNFRNAVGDLIQHRIVLGSDLSETRISGEHIVLGWALVLKELSLSLVVDGPDHARDKIMRVLEPAASNDAKSAAIYVAIILSFLESPQNDEAIVPLIAAWLTHHNSSQSSEKLQFFATSATTAYLQAIESIFADRFGGAFEENLIEPLAQEWRDGGEGTVEIGHAIHRWLRLIFPGGSAGSKDGATQPPERYETARSEEQLRLSSVAMGILSFRPEREFLDALIDCYFSCKFCFRDHEVGEETKWWSCKSPYEILQVLLAWHYRPDEFFEAIGDFYAQDGCFQEKSDPENFLVRLIRYAEFPKNLGDAEDTRRRLGPGELEVFANFKSYLSGDGSVKGCPSPRLFPGAHLRASFPSLTPDETESLVTQLEGLLKQGDLPSDHIVSEVQSFLPMVARYSGHSYDRMVETLFSGAISRLPSKALMSLGDWCPGSVSPTFIDEVVSAASRIEDENLFDVLRLSELVFLFGSVNQQMEWLEGLSEVRCRSQNGPAIGYIPLPMVFGRLAAPETREFVRERLGAVLVESNNGRGKGSDRAAHWMLLFEYMTEPSLEEGQWAKRIIEAGPSGALLNSLFSICIRGADRKLFEWVMQNPELKNFQNGVNDYLWEAAFRSESCPTFSTERIFQHCSMLVSGILFAKSENAEGLRIWGRRVLAAAREMLADSSHEPGVRVFADLSDDQADTRHVFVNDNAAWGLDVGGIPQSLLDEWKHGDSGLPTIVFKQISDEDRNEFGNLSFAYPIHEWAKMDPEEFEQLAISFLDEMQKTGDPGVFGSRLGGFEVVLCQTLLREGKDSALRYFRTDVPKANIPLRVIREGLEWQIDELWNQDLNGTESVTELRRTWLETAPNDESIMWQVIGAVRNENDDQFSDWVEEWCDSDWVRDRCLGVSVMAFAGGQQYLNQLGEMASADPSYWVRDHAKWAAEVVETEIGVRKAYQVACSTENIAECCRSLATITPFHSPLLSAVRHRLERDSRSAKTDPRLAVRRECFWRLWMGNSRTTTNVELGGRKLQSFSRGFELKEGTTKLLAPWWRLRS